MSFHLVSANKVLRLARLTALCKYCSKTHSTLFIFQSSILLRFRYLFVYPVSFTYVVFVPFSYVFFFCLKWQCATRRIKIESTLIPIFLFTPLHLVFFFSTAFRRRLCFVRENSLACAWKWIYDAIDILFDNTVVIMRCYFSVPFGLILSHLTNPTQNVPSCIIECVTNKFSSSYCWHFMAV